MVWILKTHVRVQNFKASLSAPSSRHGAGSSRAVSPAWPWGGQREPEGAKHKMQNLPPERRTEHAGSSQLGFCHSRRVATLCGA